MAATNRRLAKVVLSAKFNFSFYINLLCSEIRPHVKSENVSSNYALDQETSFLNTFSTI